MSVLSAETVLSRRGLYMLPTVQGWMFALLLSVLLATAINYGNSLGYALTFVLAAVAIISMLYTHRNLLHLRVRAGACTPVFVGDSAVFPIHLVNDAPTPRYALAVMREQREVARVNVSAGTSTTVELRVAAQRRGWLVPPAFYLCTRFPLGFLYSWTRRIALTERCLVYPTPSDPWPWRPQADAAEAGAARPVAAGDDFAGVREYRPGDSPRQIDWKSAARGRGLLTKEFAGGLSETVWLELARMPAADIETRLSLLCRALLDAEQAGLHYGLQLAPTVVPPDCGEVHQQRCLRALALYGQD